MKKSIETSNRTTPSDKRIAVIWTRVSSKDQKDNLSLDIQEHACLDYAEKHGIIVDKILGQTNESAKTEGKLYHEMIAYVSSHRAINTILVYSFDRFSRAGAEAIVTKAFLKSKGITVVSVTQPIDADNMAGEFLENLLFLFNQFENQLRRSKCNAGMLASLERGDWYTKPPVGYKIDRTAKEKHRFIIDEKGELIRMAFQWKAYERITDTEIQCRWLKMGWDVERKRVPQILENPFYYGMIRHNMLGDRLVKGNQPPIIDEETFRIANGLENRKGYEQTALLPEVPLRKHVRCTCGRFLTGYEVRKKRIWYYKCNTRGCSSNISAKALHRMYMDLLAEYIVPVDGIDILQAGIEEKLDRISQLSIQREAELRQSILDLKKERKETVTRFGIGKIPKEVYKITIDSLDQKIKETSIELDDALSKKSNQSIDVRKAIITACHLQDYWKSASPADRVKIQNMAFPSGVSFSKETGFNRTPSENEALRVIRLFTSEFVGGRIQKKEKPEDFSFQVAPRGIEPRFKV